jgi:hypothetical protein
MNKSCGESCFQLRQSLFETLYLALLIADLRLLALHFVQQHRVEHLILHGLDLSVGGMSDQVRVDLIHFLGDQTVLNRLGTVGECFGRRKRLPHMATQALAKVVGQALPPAVDFSQPNRRILAG